MKTRETTVCPKCGKEVTFKWDGGFVTEPHNVLVADWVFHTKCWDEIEKSDPENFPRD